MGKKKKKKGKNVQIKRFSKKKCVRQGSVVFFHFLLLCLGMGTNGCCLGRIGRDGSLSRCSSATSSFREGGECGNEGVDVGSSSLTGRGAGGRFWCGSDSRRGTRLCRACRDAFRDAGLAGSGAGRGLACRCLCAACTQCLGHGDCLSLHQTFVFLFPFAVLDYSLQSMHHRPR
ncbi:hypothetical protein M408DRAFT_190541 [Serendipita vermifera MAFF 305830]|uniref:Uncharacterized protein n=1 Tax=Serendipita vermifera MAFF 305830 TaxID=933852 RepID=A0A0C3B862_SERVB|nr:hypothetical protein M408DRAFT_190541 [Serendipita vermifera MAFF 305830]